MTAGPGLSNTITAVKNAQLAQSPMILFGGATSDLLKGRHSLQGTTSSSRFPATEPIVIYFFLDIDQFALLKPHVKWSVHVKRVQDIVPNLGSSFHFVYFRDHLAHIVLAELAFFHARSGTPGPVFIEIPVLILLSRWLLRVICSHFKYFSWTCFTTRTMAAKRSTSSFLVRIRFHAC